MSPAPPTTASCGRPRPDGNRRRIIVGLLLVKLSGGRPRSDPRPWGWGGKAGREEIHWRSLLHEAFLTVRWRWLVGSLLIGPAGGRPSAPEGSRNGSLHRQALLNGGPEFLFARTWAWWLASGWEILRGRRPS